MFWRLAAALIIGLIIEPAGATTSLRIDWGAATPATGSSGIFGYNVYRCTGAACTPTTLVGSSPSTTYFDTTTAASTTYCYVEKAFGENLIEGPANAAVCKTTLAANTINASACTDAAVNTAISSAVNGDIIVVPASGACSFATAVNLPITKGVSIVCASSCTIPNGNLIFVMPFWSSNIDFFYRISGFTFTGGTTSFVIWFCSGGGCTGTLSNVRIDHNTFTLGNLGVAAFFGENTSMTHVYGVVDHNTVNGAGNVAISHKIGLVDPTILPSPLGTANNMFFEDNTVNITTLNNAGHGCVDTGGPAEIVWRHNSVTNCLVTSHGVSQNGGMQNFEYYNNSTVLNSGSNGSGNEDCTRCFHSQGSGMYLFFNNQFTSFLGKSTDVMAILHYCDYLMCIDGGGAQCDGARSQPPYGDPSNDGNRTPLATYRGYPCAHQPARDFSGKLVPVYGFNNRWSDTQAQIPFTIEDIGGTPDYKNQHFVADRDYFLPAGNGVTQSSATSPFDGTTGTGWGTLARRPTTCSTAATDAPDAGKGGVGYFATDKGAQGTLYNCGTTNTWSIFYQPYIYPHPLVGIM